MTTEATPGVLGANEGLGVLVAQRAAFEAWIKTQPGYPFAGVFANLMWQSWQGAVAAERERYVRAIDAVPTHQWIDGSDYLAAILDA